MTFSSKYQIEKKSGKDGLGRFQYLQALINEYQKTHNKDIIAEEEENKIKEFAMGGLCNCCLDKANMIHLLLDNDCVELTIGCLTNSNEETVLSAITTLIYLLNSDSKSVIGSELAIRLMKEYSQSDNRRLSNLANIFLQDFNDLM